MSKTSKLQDKIDNVHIEQRKIFIWGMVNDQTAKHCVDRLLYLDSVSHEEITFFINSPGGYVTSGFSIYDTMQQIKSQ
ncbi:ATP-dependent Clp protease proteolytic subunit [Nonlabens ulvanivorans]|nr:ATP-dependent Clp protease proteolytic subunit [Nonlabens ulvanivorans]